MMLASREAAVDYMTPLGLHHQMARGHHYGPGPWVSERARADWNSTYYHRADADGIGFDRTRDRQQRRRPVLRRRCAAHFGQPRHACPSDYLLWFHHVPWDHRMASGRTLWDELIVRYQPRRRRRARDAGDVGRARRARRRRALRGGARLPAASRSRRRAGGATPASSISRRSRNARSPPMPAAPPRARSTTTARSSRATCRAAAIDARGRLELGPPEGGPYV